MSAPTYDAYRDSGIDWLGKVPSHWKIDRLKASVASSKGGIWGEEADGGEEDIVCIRVADFRRRDFSVSMDDPTVRKIAAKDRHGRLVLRGNLLLEKSGGGEKQPVGAVSLYDHDVPAVCSNFVARLELAAGMHPPFWCYVHAAAYDRGLTVRSLNQTSGIQNLDQARYLDERAAYPPLAEQAAIAAFLDRETGRIDALVAAQTRLIELLKEKRQAVISHAVTKGLDPAAPMKDSGVEWLGQVPAHWEVVPTRSLISLRRQQVGERHAEFQLLSLTLRGVIVRDRESGHGKFPTEFNTYQVVRPNDLVFCLFDMDETPRTVGISPHDGMITGAYDVFASPDVHIAEFIYWLYLGRDFKKTLRPFYTGLRKVIRKETFGSIPLALPPAAERQAIVAFLNETTRQLDELAAQAEAAVTLLRERRAALISAAVTGKIDVRGLAPEQAEAA